MSNRNIPLGGDTGAAAAAATGGDKSKLEMERVKKGLCPTCGTTATHKVEKSLFGRKRQPLTVEGECLRGICLRCNGPPPPDTAAVTAKTPSNNTNLPNIAAINNSNRHSTAVLPPPPHHHPHPPHASSNNTVPVVPITAVATPFQENRGVPQELIVRSDATVVSQITLDHRFGEYDDGGGDQDSEEYDTTNFAVRPGERRPEPSLCDADDDVRPERWRPSRRQPHHPQGHNNNMMTAEVTRVPHHHGATPPYNSHNNNNNNNNNNPLLAPFAEEKTEIEPADVSYYKQPPPLQAQTHPAQHHPIMTWSGELSTVKSNNGEEEYYHGGGVETTADNNHNMSSSSNPQRAGTGLLAEIPTLVDQLTTHPLQVLTRLSQIVWTCGQDAKWEIIAPRQHNNNNNNNDNALSKITKSMWASMGDAQVQEAAVHLLFGLAASSDASADNDVLVGESADDVVDALLIVMQQFLTVENIQHSGCGILACLAAASGNNPNVNDGSLSGALNSVVSAMEAHRNSKRIQEYGIRCLNHLCLHSRHAESNKRILAKAGMEDVSETDILPSASNTSKGQQSSVLCGASIIYQAIELSEADMVTVEWACRLYWCLSASAELAELVTAATPIHVMLEALQLYHKADGAAGLIEAIFGALTNMVKVRENYKVVDSSVLYLIIAAAQAHRKNVDLQIEAFALMANLIALVPDAADVAVDAEAIKIIFKAIKTFPHNPELFEEASRVLSCLCIISEDAKGHLSTPTMLSYLSLATTTHKDSILGQEMFFFLLSSILTQKTFWKTLVAHGGVDMIVTAMKNHPNDKRVQEAACLTMRNLACGDTDAAPVDFSEPINLIIRAMANHASSPSVQLHGCCALWNLAFVNNKNQFKFEVSDNDMIQCIVKAMQNHLESAAVLEMACGALCSKISGSEERKQSLVACGGLDAVTCVLVMHPNESSALENACGVLSSMSVSPGFADDVESTQCVSNVVETMRSNASSIRLLEFGCMVLRNIILVRNDYAVETSSVVGTILQAMRDNPDEVTFQREACSLLWAMAAVCESCKAKVLSLDGITVLLNCLEHNGSDVQDAALGAFNQLSGGIQSPVEHDLSAATPW